MSAPTPDLAPPPPNDAEANQAPLSPPPAAAADEGPGTFEDLHKKAKEVFPSPWEGAKLVINKGLSNHFQISHTLTMSSLQPSGYRFGATYVGTQQFSPTEAFPILIGDIDPSGNLNANIIHQFSKNLRGKFVSQIQNGRWTATQLTSEYRGKQFTAALTAGNPDFLSMSGVLVWQYMQNITKNLAMGTELLYQRGPQVPGSQLAMFTLAGRYSGDNWQVAANITPAAGGVHTTYYHKASDQVQVGVELEGSLRTQECLATLGYQMEIPTANMSFRGQVDTNYGVGAVLEKKLLPLPFTFALSAYANHGKNSYRFGIGLMVG